MIISSLEKALQFLSRNMAGYDFNLGALSGRPLLSMQTVIGAVLIAVSFFTFWALPVSAGLFASGVGMVAGGVIQMLSPQAGGLQTSAAPENPPGHAFGSAKNTTASGNPVPLCYGKRRVGGVIISAAIYAEDKL